MGKMPHNLDLFNETLLAIFLTVGTLFGEGLDCVLEFAVDSLHQIHGGEVALTDLLDRLEGFVKSPLIEILFQYVSNLSFVLSRQIKAQSLFVLLEPELRFLKRKLDFEAVLNAHLVELDQLLVERELKYCRGVGQHGLGLVEGFARRLVC